MPIPKKSPRLAQDTEEVIRRTQGEAAFKQGQQPAAPVNTKPDYTKQNVEAVEYGDTTIALVANVNRVASPARTGRRYMFVLNIGANQVNLSFGKPASGNNGIPLPTNGFYEPLVPPAGSINLFSALGSSVVVVEG